MKYLPQSVLIASFVVFLLFPIKNVLALTLSPARLEIVVNKGDRYVGELKILNEQSETKTFYSSFENFEASGDTGTPNFVKATEGLATWISSEKEITLAPGEEKTVPFIIDVPQNARAGGHFAAIFWGTTPTIQSGPSDIAVGARIGSLILLKVNGEIKEGGGITEITTESGENIFAHLPINLVYTFNNTGDDRLNPNGTIEIKNTFGIKVASLDANPSKGNILPQSARKFIILWGDQLEKKGFFGKVLYQIKHPAIGLYTVTAKLTYGQNNTETKDKVSLFILPWQLLLCILFALLICWIIFVRIVKQRRRLLKKQRELEAKIKKLEELTNQEKMKKMTNLKDVNSSLNKNNTRKIPVKRKI